jgi:hypothetical protein
MGALPGLTGAGFFTDNALILQDVTVYNAAASAASFAVPMSSQIVAGDYLLAFVAGASSSSTIGIPSGWSRIISSSSPRTHGLFWKPAISADAGANTTWVPSASISITVVMFVLRNADVATAPAFTTKVATTSGTPRPNNLTPSWGPKRNLWVTWLYDGNYPALGGYPSGYDLAQNDIIGTVGARHLSLAARYLDAASEQPPAWSATAGFDYAAYTIAIKPLS